MSNAGDDEVESGVAASSTDDPEASGAPAKGGGKGSKKAAKAAKRKAAKASKLAKRDAAVAKKSASKAAKKAATQVAKAEKAAKHAQKATRQRAKAAEKEARRAGRVAEATLAGSADPEVASDAGKTGGKDHARAIAGKAGGMALASGAMLSEVAGLVRQATEPAASRIVDRVTGRPGAEPQTEARAEPPAEVESTEPEPAAEPEAVTEPAEAPDTEPVAAPNTEPELAAEPDTEPELAAEPEAVTGPAADPDTEPEAPDTEPRADIDPDDASRPGAEAAAVAEFETSSETSRLAQPYQDPWAYPVVAPSSPQPPVEPAPAPESSAPPMAIEIPPGAVIGAAIDVGATSVHLLVAAVGGHRVEPLLDESSFLGLGDRISADGRLGREAREELVVALVGYAETARQLGASRITVVGTDPMRRADDAAAVVHAVEARAGVPLHILDHDEEGLLMLLGVTKGRPITANLLVVDVGGGSAQFVVVDPAGEEHAMGLPLGAARLTRDLVHTDPPSLAELEALKVRVREILVDAPGVDPGEIVVVGGTASNLLKLLPATALDRVLTRRRLTVALAMLTVERSLEAAERHLVRPARARILPAGAIIVDAILERYGADRLRVSEEGIREGLALAAAAAGPAWRDRLPRLVRGWSDEDWPLE